MKVGLIAVAATALMIYYDKEIVEAIRGKQIPPQAAQTAQEDKLETPVFKAIEEIKSEPPRHAITDVQALQKGRSEQEKEYAWSNFYKKSKRCEQQDNSTTTMVECGNEYSRQRAKFEKQWTEEAR